MRLTHLSLFSGIGGIDLAAEWAGFETIAMVERDPFCQKVLAKHWPGVPIFDDVTTFGAEALRNSVSRGCRGESRRRAGAVIEDGYPRVEERVHLLSGGFPCQPFSVAGKRKGSGDERFLWDEMLRVIREVEPVWVLGENVRGLLSIDGGRTFGTIIHELAEVGYRVGWGVYGACHVAAPHRRERVFIVAYSDRSGRREQRWPIAGVQEHPAAKLNGRWEPEPPVGRVVAGLPNRVDRLRALGNAVVPQQAYPILKAIAETFGGAA